MKKILVGIFLAFSINCSAVALDAQSNGQWISVGVPKYIHQGTNGEFYLNGDNQGSCDSVQTTYFRINMDAPHFGEFYSWLMVMATTKKSLECAVDSGCGSSQIWVKYCRGSLE